MIETPLSERGKQAMESQVYKDMLDVMIKRGGSYAGMDIPEFYELVQELFTPEEAELNNALSRNPVTAAEVAQQKGRSEEEVTALLGEHGEQRIVRHLSL